VFSGMMTNVVCRLAKLFTSNLERTIFLF
jgi:hypothetical protein